MSQFFAIVCIVFLVVMYVLPLLASRQFGKANALRRARRDSPQLQTVLASKAPSDRDAMLTSLIASSGDTANKTLDTLIAPTAEEEAFRAKGRTINKWANWALLAALASLILSIIL
jgi:hypothetical protein